MKNEINYAANSCMKFSNNELYEGFISKLEKDSRVDIKILAEDDTSIEVTSTEPIQFICLDGEKQDLFISFYGNQTSIFIKDKELMFIDESTKEGYTTSDTFRNIVYEGNLRTLSHMDILELFVQIISCFIGATTIKIIEKDILDDGVYKKYSYYTPHLYEIEVNTSNSLNETKVFENIVIKY